MLPGRQSPAPSGLGGETVLAAQAPVLELGPGIEYVSQAKKSSFSVLDYKGDKHHSFWPRPSSSLTCTQPPPCAENNEEEQDVRVLLWLPGGAAGPGCSGLEASAHAERIGEDRSP